jgi:transposase-like protein
MSKKRRRYRSKEKASILRRHFLDGVSVSDLCDEQMVKHNLRLVRQMLNHAVDWEYLRTNPANKVRYPKKEKKALTNRLK